MSDFLTTTSTIDRKMTAKSVDSNHPRRLAGHRAKNRGGRSLQEQAERPQGERTAGQQSADARTQALENDFVVRAPSISLPKGGGAIRGIGEKFAANPVTGTASLSVPIYTSPGRSGFGPQLSLSYDSGAGNGPFGIGWNLSLPSITRKTDKGLPRYWDAQESDVFILSGAEDLVPSLKEVAAGDWQPEVVPPRVVDGKTYDIRRYRPRIEGLFARIERWTNQTDPKDTLWRSISKDNITTWYGKTHESRICDPDDSDHIFSWLICESYDDKGNVIAYRYKEEDSQGVNVSQAHERNRTVETRKANRYLKQIRYGNHHPYFPTLIDDQPWPTPPGDNHWYFEAVFDYGEHDVNTPLPQDLANNPAKWDCRHDPFSAYRAGFEVRTYRLCQRVLMFHHFHGEADVGKDCLVRSTDFTYRYEQEPSDPRNPIHSVLVSAVQCGYHRKAAGGYLKKSLPPLEFDYSKAIIQEQLREIDAECLENLPQGLDGGQYQWADLDGEGVGGILTEQGGAWFYKRNLSPLPIEDEAGQLRQTARFAPTERVSPLPSFSGLSSGEQQILDLAGDGQADVVTFDGPVPGFFERTREGDWQPFRSFTSLPKIAWKNRDLKFVDLTGDGHVDILITEDEVFTWHPSLAEMGFADGERVHQALDEEMGPRLVFADGTDTAYLSDLSGDGLTDLVRIRNGEVCYWPNLGYGRFGTKVMMDNAPWFDCPDQFDQKRIRLADIDGSGATDVLYLRPDGVRIYFNQSGNSWSDERVLDSLSAIDNTTTVMAVDLLGNGTTCLVWSSPLPGNAQAPMRYVDLMGGQKPHLLTNVVNNLGAETRVHYAPSTKFYLKDKQDGKPWITRLHFPVHVVERVETFDHISRNHFVTHYAYHHGYFDGAEREFRGFGMVEQRDTGEFEALAGDGNTPQPTTVDNAWHVPTVLTRTWFHTGIYLGRNRVSKHFAGLLDANNKGDYYREPGLDNIQAEQLLLEDSVLPDNLTIEEEREACRALKGSMLRKEVYALDGPGTADYPHGHPYTVTEQSFTIKRLQVKAGNRHAVFFAHPHEALSYHYERNPTDPRVSHAMTLEVDNYGNVQKSLVIAYGRRAGRSPLQSDDKKKQEQLLITYTESDVTNAIDKPVTDRDYDPDNYRTPLPAEARTYEVTGYDLPDGIVRFGFSKFVENNFQALTTALTEIDYKQPTDYTKKQKRLIDHVRTFYRKNDLTGLCPLKELEFLALPGESYKLAFTLGLLDQVYQRNGQPLIADYASVLKVDQANGHFADRGGYLNLYGDDHWWVPSGRVFYRYDGNDIENDAPPAQELTEAQAHFFTPRRFVDPFANSAAVDQDAYDLLPLKTIDAVGNTVVSVNDYRVLQAKIVTDPNRNQTFAAFDTLGLVVATAVAGKQNENLGDFLDDFYNDNTLDLANPTLAKLQAFVTDPGAEATGLLMRATTRIVYDLERYRRIGQPPFAATLARETHTSDGPPPGGLKIQVSFSYSDGFGREIQKKIPAEPGALVQGGPKVDPRWVGSGWTIFNSKGKPVRQYESFFDDTHEFKFGKEIGVSPVLFYDPVERVVATLHPNRTYEKVVFDPWQQTTFDVNDTVASKGIESGDPRTDPHVGGYMAAYFKTQPATWQTWHAQRITGARGVQEQDAAIKAAAHTNTPTRVHFDVLGRPFLSIANNGKDQNGNNILYETRTILDIEGNQRELIDAKGRIVMRYDYHMAGPKQNEDGSTHNRIHQSSIEAGERWILNDITGKPIRSWDSRGHEFRTVYDRLRRPIEQHVAGEDSSLPDQRLRNRTVIHEKTEYGESLPENDAIALNLRARIVKQYDGAGVIINFALNPDTNKNEAYDFKGNLLRSSRTLAAEYVDVVDWSQTPPTGDAYTSATTYDALNRLVSLTAPDNSIIRPSYNKANLLERVTANLRGAVEETNFINNIDYNAKGQRGLIEYSVQEPNGNSSAVHAEYDYEPETFRLTNLKTTRKTDGSVIQDLHYTYDPAGNITHIQDDAQQTIYFNGQVVEPHSDYIYDAIYRLIKAQGREHHGQAAQSWASFNDAGRINQTHPHDGQAMRNYTERYDYDEVGNFERLWHGVGNGASTWQRTYNYEELSLIPEDRAANLKSNRLSKSTISGSGIPSTNEAYAHDSHGNILKMPQLQNMDWDFRNQLRITLRQRVNNNDAEGIRHEGERTYYVYDAAGQRVRKVTQRQNGSRREERIYLSGFEIYRKFNGNGQTKKLERETLRIMDDKQRIALVETRTLDRLGDDPAPQQLIRFQFGNHLGSVSLELDDQARIISYEEYTPFGCTSYQAVNKSIKPAPKRYRYTGKEKDGVSGLNYHGARYYATWLGRWCSADTLISENLYKYSHNNPIIYSDLSGKKPKCKGQIGCALDPIQILEISTTVISNHGIDAIIGQKAALEYQRLADAQKEQNFEEYDEGLVNRFLNSAATSISNLLERITPEFVSEADSSLRQSAGELGADALDEAFGGIQNSQLKRNNSDLHFYVDPKEMGSDLGKFAYDQGTGVLAGGAIKLIAMSAAFTTVSGFRMKSWIDNVLVGVSRSQFRRNAQKIIKETPGHPLKELLVNGRLINSTKKGMDKGLWANDPRIVEAGHVVSKKTGSAEKLILMSASKNRFLQETIENSHFGGAVELVHEALDLGGIAVDIELAQDLVRKGILTVQDYADARLIQF